MKSALCSFAGALLLVAAGCSGYFTVDGYDAAYASAPAGYERSPRYMHHGADVYEVQGRYYRQYNNRWVVYRERPRELERRAEERR
jgi:hypothetical protein